MTKLVSYNLTAVNGADYTVTMTFDDNSTSTQTLHFTPLQDSTDPMTNVVTTAAEQLTSLVQAYAVAYIAGINATPPPPDPNTASLTSIINIPQTV